MEFDSSIKGMNQALTGLKKEFQTINHQLKFDPDNVDLLNKKMTNLQEQARVGALKIQELKKQQAALGKEKVGTAEWNKLGLEIAKVEGQMQVVDRALQATGKHLKDVGDPKSVYNLNKALEETASDLDTVDKKLKLDPSNVQAAEEKMKLLKQQSELAAAKVEALKKQQKALGDENIGTAEWKKLDKEIVEAELEAKKFDNALKDIDKDSDQLGKIGSKIDLANMQRAADTLARAGQSVINFSAKALDAFRDIDDAMDTITGKTGLASDGFKDVFKNIVNNIAVDNLTDVGSAIGEINTQFGLLDKPLESASTAMLKFAQINGTDVTNSTINAKRAMDLFKMSSEQLPSVLDAVTGTAQRTGVSVDDLFAGVQKGAPALTRMGLDFGQSVEVLGQFQKAGLNSDKTIAALTKATSAYAKEGLTLNQGLTKTTEAIKNATTDQKALNLATKIFGTKNAPAMVDAIKNGTLNFQNFGKVAEENANLVGDTFEKQKDPIDQLTVAQNQLKLALGELGATIAESLAPVLEGVGKAIGNIAKIFSNLPGPVKQFIVILGSLLAVFSLLLPVIAAIVAIFMTGLAPALGIAIGVIAGVAAAIVAIIAIIKNWGKITEWLKGVWSNFTTWLSNLWDKFKQDAINVWQGTRTGIINVFNNFVNAIKTTANKFISFWKTSWNVVKTVVITVWDAIKATITTIAKAIFSVIKLYVNAYVTFWKTAWNIIQTVVTTVWNTIKTIITTAIKAIVALLKGNSNSLINIFKTAFNTIKSTISNAWNNIKTIFQNGVSGIIGSVTGIASKIAAHFKNIPNAIRNAIGNLSSIGRKIIDDIISGLGNLASRIKQKISSAINTATKGISGAIFGKSFNGSFGDFGGAVQSMYRIKSPQLPYLPFAGAAAGTTNNATNINIQVDANNSSGLDIARAIERQLVRRLSK